MAGSVEPRLRGAILLTGVSATNGFVSDCIMGQLHHLSESRSDSNQI